MIAKGILFCCCLNFIFSKSQVPEQISNFWKIKNPGDLLKSLDTITASSYHLTQPLQGVSGKDEKLLPLGSFYQARLKRRTESDSVESLEGRGRPYDYDKAYEEFVKKYFEDSVTDALSASDSKENGENKTQETDALSNEEEVESYEEQEPLGEASIKSSKSKKCKNITRGLQNCIICKNPRNGETSENCSYNQETVPHSYKFEEQKNYHKYLAPSPYRSDEEDSSEHTSAVKRSAQLKKSDNYLTDHSICSIKKSKNKICYQCENPKGEEEEKCFAEEIARNSNSKEQVLQRKKNKASFKMLGE